MAERHELAAAGLAVLAAAGMVAGHVTLDASCPDRLYLNGYAATSCGPRAGWPPA
jgi:hypothetical protein